MKKTIIRIITIAILVAPEITPVIAAAPGLPVSVTA